jgi:4-amino-4-deoxy-L-arabinose transferase-like glycosyltransferase
MRGLTGIPVLVALVALGAIIRTPWLAAGGTFDLDQGRDMLVLRSMIEEGMLPLLGPGTSIGGVHHGATYFYLLAPVAWISGLEPDAVTLVFVVTGLLTVALAWWLAGSIGGPVAGFAAGLFVAVSPTAITASTTIWNPNLVPAASLLAVGGAWQAWRTERARWWVLAIGATALAAQLHLLATILALPIVALLVADLRRADNRRRRLGLGALVLGLAVAAVVALPLVVHELSTGFAETRAMLAFLVSPREPGGPDPVSRLLIVAIRISAWPIAGLITEAPVLAALMTGVVLTAAGWLLVAARGPGRVGERLVAGILLGSVVALPFAAPELARVTPGLPNDHYHAFTDPLVAVILGLAAARLWRRGGSVTDTGEPRREPSPATMDPGGATGNSTRSRTRWTTVLPAAALVLLVVVAELARLPPVGDPDGGWRAALGAAERVDESVPAGSLMVAGVPPFKPTGALRFPLLRLGRGVIDLQTGLQEGAADGVPAALVVICDRLFETVVAAPCGGPAESALEDLRYPALAARFELSPRLIISVYLPSGAGAGDPGR